MVLIAADQVEVEDAIEVLPYRRAPPPTSKFARASRKLRHREPTPPPHPGATGDAALLQGAGSTQSSAMVGGESVAKRQKGSNGPTGFPACGADSGILKRSVQ